MKGTHITSGAFDEERSAPALMLLISCLLTLLFLTACSTTRDAVPVSKSADPVIFIHGTMGSRLVERHSKRVIWGDFSRDAASGKSLAAIRGMALPMQRGRSLVKLHDTTKAVSSLDAINLSLLGAMRVNVTIYGDAMKRFQHSDGGGDAGPSSNCHSLVFVYDWRRGSDENARLLAKFIKSRKADFVKRRGFSEDMKFNVVAHSQGGLVLRYYLRYGDAALPRDGSLPVLTWAGARDVGKVALLGPPNAGVAPTLDYLTDGHQARAFFPKYSAAVVGSMPSLYQMLPRAGDGVLVDPDDRRSLDPLDYDLWVRKEWGLANPDQDEDLRALLPGVTSPSERRAIALDHLRKCLASARQFQAALDRPARRPAHLKTLVYAGNSIRTMAGFLATPRHLKLDRMEQGDGTVVLSSALSRPPGREDAFFFDRNHLDLACDRTIDAHILTFFGSGN